MITTTNVLFGAVTQSSNVPITKEIISFEFDKYRSDADIEYNRLIGAPGLTVPEYMQGSVGRALHGRARAHAMPPCLQRARLNQPRGVPGRSQPSTASTWVSRRR